MRARAHACASKCERGSVSAQGGGRELNLEREGGGISAGRQTIMKSKLRRYERTAKGTGKRFNGIGVQAAGDAMRRDQLFYR